jgi:hypothetical protein
LDNTALEYLIDEGIGQYINFGASDQAFESERHEMMAAVDPENRIPFPPVPADLARLHQSVRTRKVTTVLEFGVGYSTLVMADALLKNRQDHGGFVNSKLRRNNAFEIHAVDADAEFMEKTKSLLPENLAEIVHFHQSDVVTVSVDGRVATYYESMPNISPDFIYLDAPDQFIASGDIRGISTRHPDRMPMSADILAFEHFLTPGTLILIDGRTANARYLASNLQRGWVHDHDELSDVHTFELKELPLGPYNRLQIEFCLGPEWLAGLE